MEGFYVTMKRGSRTAYLLGPYDTRAGAEGQVDTGSRLAAAVDAFTAFDAFGVTKVTTRPGRELSAGKLNHRMPGVMITVGGHGIWAATKAGELVAALRWAGERMLVLAEDGTQLGYLCQVAGRRVGDVTECAWTAHKPSGKEVARLLTREAALEGLLSYPRPGLA